jgi:hypothetical protein
MQIFHQLRQQTNQNNEAEMIKNARGKPFNNTQATNPKLNSKRTKAEASTFQVT